MKRRQTDRTDINRSPLRTKAQCRKFLESHFLYQNAYAVRVRIRNIKNKTLEEETALWEAISYEGHPAWNTLEWFRNEYWTEGTDREFTYCLEGRSNGYATLQSADDKGLGVHPVQLLEELEFATLDTLQEEARMVRKFDIAVERMVRAFITTAVGHYRETQKP